MLSILQGVAALLALNVLEQEERLSEMSWGSTEHLHLSMEAMRLGFVDALAHNADPEVSGSIRAIVSWQ